MKMNRTGLLTHASTTGAAFPETTLQWPFGAVSTLTVAGQWRILTAFP